MGIPMPGYGQPGGRSLVLTNWYRARLGQPGGLGSAAQISSSVFWGFWKSSNLVTFVALLSTIFCPFSVRPWNAQTQGIVSCGAGSGLLGEYSGCSQKLDS